MASVDVNLTPATVTTLTKKGYRLLVYRVTSDADPSVAPLLWGEVRYSATTHIPFSSSLEAFTSPNPIAANKVLTPGFSTSIALGQILRVKAGGIGNTLRGGTPGTVSWQNRTGQEWTCGISAPLGGIMAPFVATSVSGKNSAELVPTNRVLLRFSSETTPVGTILTTPKTHTLVTSGPCLLVDVGSTPRKVRYDANGGWHWGGFTWGQQLPSSANLARHLITPGKTALAMSTPTPNSSRIGRT